MKVYYTCKHCGHEMEVHVVINEENDLGESCVACGAVIPDEAHAEVETAAIEKAADFHDYD